MTRFFPPRCFDTNQFTQESFPLFFFFKPSASQRREIKQPDSQWWFDGSVIFGNLKITPRGGSADMRDHPQAKVVLLSAYLGCESLCEVMFFPESSMQQLRLGTKSGTLSSGKLGFQKMTAGFYFSPTCTQMFLSVTIGIVVLWPQGIAGKVSLPESTHSKPCRRASIGDAICSRQVGTQRKLSPLLSHCSGGVNLSGICWESGGNLLSTGVFIPLFATFRHVLQHRPPPPTSRRCSDDKTTSCLGLLLFGDEQIRLVFASRPHSPGFENSSPSPRQILNMHLVTPTWGCLETFYHKLWWPLGVEHCQGSANNKAEATSKIIKVLFLRTSMELQFHSADKRDLREFMKPVKRPTGHRNSDLKKVRLDVFFVLFFNEEAWTIETKIKGKGWKIWPSEPDCLHLVCTFLNQD